MNFSKYFLVVMAVVLVLFSGQSEANFFKKVGKKLEGAVQRTRDATFQTLAVAQAAANVAATAKQG